MAKLVIQVQKNSSENSYFPSKNQKIYHFEEHNLVSHISKQAFVNTLRGDSVYWNRQKFCVCSKDLLFTELSKDGTVLPISTHRRILRLVHMHEMCVAAFWCPMRPLFEIVFVLQLCDNEQMRNSTNTKTKLQILTCVTPHRKMRIYKEECKRMSCGHSE